MRISIVIPTYNAAETLGEQLDAIAGQQAPVPFEVVVADNGSTDDTVALARERATRFDRLIVVLSGSQRGAAHARNAGAAAATGTDLLFCDADDVVADGWLMAMARALDVHPFVAARLDHRRLNPDWTLRYRGEPQRDTLEGGDGFLPFAWGCSIGIRADLHRAAGGFDESFPSGGGEDNDYCWRIQALGTPIVLVSDAVIHVRHRSTLRGVYRQSRVYGRAGAVLLTRYRELGLREPARNALKDWTMLFVRFVPSLRSREQRAVWVSSVGWRLGRREGRNLS